MIVDEASMLTEEMLAALIDALKGVDRFILVGDPRQLPPIGAGRPFVDIVEQLKPAQRRGYFPSSRHRLRGANGSETTHRRGPRGRPAR